MTKKEFQHLTGLSRGQVDRLCVKGRFHVQGIGYFIATKQGTEKTSPIDIQAEAKLRKEAADSPPPSPSPPPSAPPGMDTPEGLTLKDQLTLMQIRKIEQQLEEGKRSIRNEYRAELVELLARILAPLHETFTRMNLNAEQIASLSDSLNSSLRELEHL